MKMPLHIGLPHGHHSADQQATREARRALQQRVRNDWTYPDAPHPDRSDAKAAVTAHVFDPNDTSPSTGTLSFEPEAWRAREYSENDTSEDEAEDAAAVAAAASSGSGFFRNRSKRRPDTSESAESLADRKQRQKRRRQERFEGEMTWNIGLAHFTAQRNAWTCARTNVLTSSSSSSSASPTSPTDPCTTTSTSSVPESQTSLDHSGMHIDGRNGTTPHHHHPGGLAIAEDATVILPIAPRLLPEHPVRNRITTSVYSEIYGKVILQSRTPTVPINLQDVTNALIHGWKEEGNWPPKPAPPEPSIVGQSKRKEKEKEAAGSLKHPHLSRGVSVVSKVFHGLTGIDGSPKKGQMG